jgi:hypothetical protein
MVRFTPSAINIRAEKVSDGTCRFYRVPAIAAGSDDREDWEVKLEASVDEAPDVIEVPAPSVSLASRARVLRPCTSCESPRMPKYSLVLGHSLNESPVTATATGWTAGPPSIGCTPSPGRKRVTG